MTSSTATPTEEEIDKAIAEASEELGLASYYRSIVKPLVRNPQGPRPRCCGAGCEPCSDTLSQVADRALQLLGIPRPG